MIVFAALVGAALAHNWLHSLSRTAPFASRQFPVVTSPDDKPHVKVIAGQMFQIEWVTGHASDHFFAILKKSDEKSMNQHSVDLFNTYIAGAPGGGTPTHKTAFQKYHRKYDENARQAFTSNTGVANQTMYKLPHLKPGDKSYITRPAHFVGVLSGNSSGAVLLQAAYDEVAYPACTTNDKRAEYKSTEFPWLLSVTRYVHCANEPRRADVALFRIPAGSAPGDYIVHSWWQGYYDAVDVEVVAGTVPVPEADIYPVPPAVALDVPMTYKRIDHCAYTAVKPVGPCLKIVTDIQSCAVHCDGKTPKQCVGIAMVPVLPPPDATLEFDPFPERNNKNKLCTDEILDAIKLNATASTLACYAVEPDTESDFPLYEVYTDPADPRFYGSCWVRQTQRATPGVSRFLKTPKGPAYRFEDRCSTCTDFQRSSYGHFQPRWNLPSLCVDCGTDGIKFEEVTEPRDFSLETSVPWASIVRKGQKCRDRDQNTTLFKCTDRASCDHGVPLLNAIALNAGGLTERDCYEMAKRDPVCDGANLIMYRETDALVRECRCYMSDKCCGPCQWANSASWNTYTI